MTIAVAAVVVVVAAAAADVVLDYLRTGCWMCRLVYRRYCRVCRRVCSRY